MPFYNHSRRFGPGAFVFAVIQAMRQVRFGRVNAVTDQYAFVEIAPGAFVRIAFDDLILLPDRHLKAAKIAVDATRDISAYLKAVPVLVTAAAAPNLCGGAATMNALKTLGAGSAAAGIVYIAAVPAMLTAAGLAQLSSALENDSVTADAVKVAGVTGVFCGSAASIAAVSASGSVAGLSGSGITSGLAALGGGTIASGGFGMMGGLVACCGIAMTGTALVCGAGWVVTRTYRQAQIEREYDRRVRDLVDRKFDIPAPGLDRA